MAADQDSRSRGQSPWRSLLGPAAVDLPPVAKLDPSRADGVKEPVESMNLAPKPGQQPATQIKNAASAVLKTALGTAKKGVNVVPTFKDV
ncbi:hypothetical protein FRC07_013056, partial [Ceratobasidium sp. 392]